MFRKVSTTIRLVSHGYHVLRFTNDDVLNDMEGVVLSVLQAESGVLRESQEEL